MPPVFRFAPSPNGYLHLGHALSALLNADMARAAGGRLLLRIEDIDTTRCRPEYEAAIYEDLRLARHRLGTAGAAAVRALRRLPRGAGRLDAMGLIYPSFESRAEIARTGRGAGGDSALAARSRRRAALSGRRQEHVGAPSASGASKPASPTRLRLDMAGGARARRRADLDRNRRGTERRNRTVAADPAAWGDVILARKETPTSYHLAVVVDDAAQGVTDVVRGRDLFHATSVHRLLQALLGLPQPRYHHHRLILDADGNKLSKSTQPPACANCARKALTPADIRRLVGLD